MSRRRAWVAALAVALCFVHAGEAVRTVSGAVWRVVDGDTALVQAAPRGRGR